MNRKNAFSIPEMLAVIAIIVIIISILLPSLAGSKRIARHAICKSNLHQWGLIFAMYTQDNDGYFYSGLLPSFGADVAHGDWWRECRRSRFPPPIRP